MRFARKNTRLPGVAGLKPGATHAQCSAALQGGKGGLKQGHAFSPGVACGTPGGRGGIRVPETLAGLMLFKTAAVSSSKSDSSCRRSSAAFV